MKKLLLLPVILISCSSSNDEKTFLNLVDSEWQRGIDNNPIYASSIGDLRFNQDWQDNSISYYANEKLHDESVLEKLNALSTDKFSEDEKLNFLLFSKQYQDQATYQKFDFYLMPFSHRGGIQLEHETVSILPFRNKQHYLDWIERLNKLPIQIDNVIERASLGIDRGMVPPRILMTRVLGQIRIQAETSPSDSPFYKIFNLQLEILLQIMSYLPIKNYYYSLKIPIFQLPGIPLGYQKFLMVKSIMSLLQKDSLLLI